MRRQTVGQDKALYELKLEYEYARDSDVRVKHIEDSKVYQDFYYGRHWTETEKLAMDECSMIPITVNKVETIVNIISSLLIASRKSITFKANTSTEAEQEAADNAKYLMYKVQQENNYHAKGTAKINDALKVGVGYSHFYYDPECKKFIYNDVDFREVIPDPDDQSLRMEYQSRTHRQYFVPLLELIKRYPEHKEYFETKMKASLSNRLYLNDFYNNGLIGCPDWFMGKSAKIVEVYYKKNVKCYRTSISTDEQSNDPIKKTTEQYFTTFDKEDAEKVKSPLAALETQEGTQIWKATFIEDILLEHGPIVGQIPNQKYLPLIPLCLKRDDRGVPYGEIKSIIPINRAINRIYTQALHGLNSKHLLVDAALDLGRVEDIQKILDKRRGVIGVNNLKDVQFITQEKMLPFQFDALGRLDKELQFITQLYEELRGEESNAVSRVAIDARATNAARMQNPISEAYNYMLYSEGQLFLDTLRGLKDFQHSFDYHQNDQSQEVSINSDISLMNFQIYHDTSPVFNSTPDEDAAKFAEILNSQSRDLVLASPVFMQELNFDQQKSKKLNQAFLNAVNGGNPQNPDQQSTEQPI